MLVVGLIIVDWNYHGENIALIYSPAAQHYVQRGFYILLFFHATNSTAKPNQVDVLQHTPYPSLGLYISI